ncbi:MAG: dual specificity protein phosphatase [Cyanobium sp.]|nr:dual specificity protein phosphatase [Cyanobium sp.]
MLRHELALGPAPSRDDHLQLLREEGCRAVLSLCQPGEQPHLEGLDQQITWRSVPLPDHRSSEPLTPLRLEAALQALDQLQECGPVFVHCLAARERSPLVCMAWLMRVRGLSRQQALEYVSQVHPGTNPLPQHLALLV